MPNLTVSEQALTEMTVLDDLMATLMETWDKRYSFNCNRKKKVAVFERHGIQVRADETSDGELVVSYEHAPHEFTQEICTVDEAANLVELALFRDTLERLEPVGRRISSTGGSTGRKSWWRRILGL